VNEQQQKDEVAVQLRGRVVTGLWSNTILSETGLCNLSPHVLNTMHDEYHKCPAKPIRYIRTILIKHCGHRMYQVNNQYVCGVCGTKISTPTEESLRR
jgi:hypothetical protein